MTDIPPEVTPAAAPVSVDPAAAPQPVAVTVRTPPGILEILLIAVALAAILAGEIAINKPKLIFDGPLGLDECLTDSIVRDPDISHSIQAVRNGVDTNPPVYHLILRGFWMGVHKFFPNCSPRTGLRAFSMACSWLALVGVYWILRRGFSRGPALVAVLAVWAHPIVIEQSANARFYGPLLAASALMCLTLRIGGAGILRGIIIALAAMLLCTLHYFGILVLGSIVLGTLVVDDATFLRRIVRVLPTLAGPLALAPFISFIRAQAHGLTVRTWVDPFTFHTARDFAMAILSPLPLFIAVAIWAIGRLVQQKTSIGITNDPPPPDRRPLWIAAVPMFALVLVPMIIIAFSAVVQSALIPRYAISAALPLAAFVALLAKNRSATLLFLMALALSGFSVLELHSVASSRAGDLKQLADWRDETAADSAGLPIIFADRADATRLAAFAPDLAPRISIFDQRQTGIALRDFRTYELEMTGKVANFYPTPPLILPDQLAKLGQFHLIVSDPADMQNILLELPLKHDGKTIYEPLK